MHERECLTNDGEYIHFTGQNDACNVALGCMMW
jgi:hypothetical protein